MEIFLLQILGGIVLGIILQHDFLYYETFRQYYNYHRTYIPFLVEMLLFVLMVTTFLICTFCLLLSCVFSLSTGGLISKTIYVSDQASNEILVVFIQSYFLSKIIPFHSFFEQEFVYHLFGFILLLIASILFYMKLNDFRNAHSNWYFYATVSHTEGVKNMSRV